MHRGKIYSDVTTHYSHVTVFELCNDNLKNKNKKEVACLASQI